MRLLVLAYYFPPSGGAGVQRPLKWVKYLPAAGVQPEVLTVRAGAYPQLDPTLLAEVPSGVPVHRTAALDPFGLYARLTGRSRAEAVAERTDDVGEGGGLPERVARWLRANAFVPDARVGWAPFAVARGLRLLRERRFDALLSTGPPHSAHLAGWALRRATGTPWIADFRDPWTDIHYLDALPRTAAADRLDASLERGVLRAADAVTTVSPSWATLLGQKVGREVHVIHNGFDPEDFGGGGTPSVGSADTSPPGGGGGGALTIVHVGSLYDARNPAALWEALREGGGVVRIVGRVGGGVREAAERAGVPVEWVPYLPHREAVAEMQRADVLLLSTEPHACEAGHITGKLYEYLAAGRPVLGLGDPGGDAAALLTQTGGGRMFARDDVGGVRAFLGGGYRAYGGGEGGGLSPYSRPAQAARLADVVRAVAGRSLPR